MRNPDAEYCWKHYPKSKKNRPSANPRKQKNRGSVIREILFRGKDSVTGEWHYGYYRYAGSVGIIMPHDDKLVNQFVNSKTVGQFTGLKDRKRNKVFDGDIVHKNIINDEGLDAVVEWSIDCWQMKTLDRGVIWDLDWKGKDDEVIGNIYDNPELLEVVT